MQHRSRSLSLSLLSSLLSMGSKLGQWKQEERPTVWLKNTTANFRLIHTYAALPLLPSVCPKDTPQPEPTGKWGQRQRESRPEPDPKWSIGSIFSIRGVWHDSLWVVMVKKRLCTLTFLLHACFTWEQPSAATKRSPPHSSDDCRDKHETHRVPFSSPLQLDAAEPPSLTLSPTEQPQHNHGLATDAATWPQTAVCLGFFKHYCDLAGLKTTQTWLFIPGVSACCSNNT